MSKIEIIGCMDNTTDHTFESANRIYDVNGVSPTINTCGGGGLQPKIMEVVKIKQATQKGYIECDIGGGGRLELPFIQNSQRSGNRSRENKSDSDNGEYPRCA